MGTSFVRISAHFEVFHDRHGSKDLAPFRHMSDAKLRALIRRNSKKILPFVGDLAGYGRNYAGNSFEQCCFPGAVRSDDGDELALLDVKRNIAQGLQAPVGDFKRPNP